MKYYQLDPEEQAISDAFDQDEFKSVDNLTEEMARYRKIAKANLKKDKNINIRLTAKNLHDLKVMALEEGIPYQTLAASILHKYTSGKLVYKQG